MTKINWDPQTMSTGVPVVDDQHQEWIRRYNEFDNAISQGKGLEAIQSTLDFFIAYADVHFRLEESIMDSCHCPAAKTNRKDHDHIRNILQGFNVYVKKYGYSINEIISLKRRMEDWLVRHMLTVDIQLRNS